MVGSFVNNRVVDNMLDDLGLPEWSDDSNMVI
jgi:hypothetical protein